MDPANPATYNLYLTTGPAGIRVGLADIKRNKFVLLEDYVLTSDQPLAAQLAALRSQHDLLGLSGWNRVLLAVQNRAFTLLPAPLFRAGDEARYLSLHYAPNPEQEKVLHHSHRSQDIVSVFAADRELVRWFQRAYPTGRVLHQTSALLEGAVHQSEQAVPRHLYLSIGQQEMTLVAVHHKRPEFCNVFSFSTPEDLIYYTILAMQELQLNPDQDALVVWGDLTHDSELFTILRKYIRNVRFGMRPFDLTYSYRLNEVFEYRYFELYSLHLCE
nr:DUF3822 family protein [Hymenobacter translucens]